MLMPGGGGDPDRAIRASHPRPMLGLYGEDSTSDVDELVVVMPMPVDHFPGHVMMAALQHI
ncbi:hypothetical protein GCM10012278_06610 [Nonomuraea glycinis]|uniref:Uncharacterized protein n=1 Tax=Nonomuraea glycinis TaxID=2047744 RepID=A0A918E3N0_9ACTN|nr:hypothetical protein GCM10012278_06610 [Nonomuraea glycinis]